jgi:ribosomal protein L37AE/L43A
MGSATEVPVLTDSDLNNSKKQESTPEPSKGALVCPICGTQTLHRVSRTGFMQRVVFSRFGYYPWKCSSCKNAQLMKHRGERRRRRSEGE